MRRVEKSWQAAVKEVGVVALNTLATGAAQVKSRGAGVVLSALPRYDGTVSVLIAHRKKGCWRKDQFQLASNAHTLSTLEGSLKERVTRAWHAHAGLEQLSNLGKGFSGQLGADPEVFAVAKGQILPAWEFLPPKGPGNEIFWDGFQAEFTTATETCLAWFIDHVRTGLRHVHSAAKAKGGALHLADVIEVPIEMLETGEQKHVQFGCDPSKNAYNDHGQLQADPRQLQIRFAGGHMHFGLGKLTDAAAIEIVKALDAIWGVASVSMFAGLEHPLRRVYYGKAGEYRLPKHGLEYRTPSNAWMCHPAIAQLSWSLARQAVTIGQRSLLNLWKADEDEVRRIINELDVDAARKMLKKNQRIVQTLMQAYFGQNNSRLSEAEFKERSPLAVKYGMQVVMEGATTVLEAPADLVRNWMLDAPTNDDRWAKPTDKQREENCWISHSESSDKQWLLAAGTIDQGMRI